VDLAGRVATLYGRFSPGAREALHGRVLASGGQVVRDLTRRSDLLVIGARAHALIDSGAMVARLAAAKARQIPVFGERSLTAALAGAKPDEARLPLATAAPLALEEAEVLAAFDLIVLEGDNCRFEDARAVRAAADLRGQGRSLADTVRILTQARDLAPKGRHRIQLTPSGEAALAWDDGFTSLEGQGLLPLDDAGADLDDLFETAALAETRGDAPEATRLYDLLARADRTDPIAPYNLGNLHLAEGAFGQAEIAYRQALARDPAFAEARYNLAKALEAMGRLDAAQVELEAALVADPTLADALFNLAQLRMRDGDAPAAKALFERYLATDPPSEAATTARKGILYCTAVAARA
jgi:tetratricopeptide (TPR) repeat protein